MEEKILTGRKNGMLVLLLTILLYVLAALGLIAGGVTGRGWLIVLCILTSYSKSIQNFRIRTGLCKRSIEVCKAAAFMC